MHVRSAVCRVAICLFGSVVAVTSTAASAQSVPDAFAFGAVSFHGSAEGRGLSQPIVGMAATPSGGGYWLVAADDRVFERGDARVNGSVPAADFITQSIVGIAASTKRAGFWPAAGALPLSNAKIERAIGWFADRRGSGTYEGLCEEAVEIAYGTIRRYPTAYDDWLAQSDQHLDWRDAPRGALVFYKPEIDGVDGHVGISLGNGYVISTSVNHRIGVARIDSFPNPLGWAQEPW